MVTRYVAPILRLLLVVSMLAIPLVLAALAQGAEPPAAPRTEGAATAVTLRAIELAPRPGAKGGARVAASALVSVLESRGDAVRLADRSGGASGWVESSAVIVLDDPGVSLERLLDRGRLLLGQGDRTLAALAVAGEVVRRDAGNLAGWKLLGEAGEQAASRCKREGEREPALVSRAGALGARLVPTADGNAFRYDGEAYRRLLALSPPADVAEDAWLRLLTRCGTGQAGGAWSQSVSGASSQVAARIDAGVSGQTALEDPLASRERDLSGFLEAFPASTRRVELLGEKARVLAALAEARARRGALGEAEKARDAAIEAASEVVSSAPDERRRRAADRLLLRLTRSFPRNAVSAKAVVSDAGREASFVVRGAQAYLEVLDSRRRPVIQPYPVTAPDPSSLRFDPGGTKLAWDESPALGQRRTRLLDLGRIRVLTPIQEGEDLAGTGAVGPGTARPGDRYTTLVGFSPDGRSLLVISEGYSPDGVRLPRRHFLCDVEGRQGPRLVQRPFSAPGTVDWVRLLAPVQPLTG